MTRCQTLSQYHSRSHFDVLSKERYVWQMRNCQKALVALLSSLPSGVSLRTGFAVCSFTHRLSSTPTRRAQTVATTATMDDESEDGLLVSNLHHLGNDKILLILASQSPRRREILDMLGLAGKYTARPSPLDESAVQLELANKSISPIDYTRILAERKAEALAMQLSQQSDTRSILVLGSDTIVDCDDLILEKPTDNESAKTMLRRLSGAWHQVHTGVAIYQVSHNSMQLMSSFTDTAGVKFAPLSESDISAYVATGEPMDKAGSYGIQGIGGQLVERIDGDFFTVMGLPMHRTSRHLSRAISLIKTR